MNYSSLDWEEIERRLDEHQEQQAKIDKLNNAVETAKEAFVALDETIGCPPENHPDTIIVFFIKQTLQQINEIMEVKE